MTWARDYDTARIEAAGLVVGTSRGMVALKADAGRLGAVVYHEKVAEFIGDQLARLEEINQRLVKPYSLMAPEDATLIIRETLADARNQINRAGD